MPDSLERARSAVASVGIDTSDLAAVLSEVYGESYVAGTHTALGEYPDGVDAVAPSWEAAVDWSEWKPGNARAAAELAGRDGGRGLATLLSDADTTIKGISDFTTETLARTLAEGMDAGESVADLTARVSAALGDDSRAEMIARTETMRASNVALRDSFRENGMGGRQWLAASDADEDCSDYDGTVVGIDDEFDDGDPPLHPNCFPAGTVVTGPLVEATTERPYEGPVVTIRTAAGDELTGTPNHPVLTSQGWVALGLLREGQHVLRCSDLDAVGPAVDPHEHQPVALIEQVRAPSAVALFEVPVAAADFHGDGSDGDVHVELADGGFDPDVNARIREHLSEAQLGGAGVAAPFLLSESAPSQVPLVSFHAPDGVMRRGSKALALLSRSVAHPGEHGLGSVPERHAVALEGGRQSAPADAGLLRQRLDGLAGLVAPSEVVEVRNHEALHEVFNLSTAEGWYVANGIIVSNCRCTVSPVLVSEMEG